MNEASLRRTLVRLNTSQQSKKVGKSGIQSATENYSFGLAHFLTECTSVRRNR